MVNMKGRPEGAEERSKVTDLTIGHMTTSGKPFLCGKESSSVVKKRNITIRILEYAMMMDGRLTWQLATRMTAAHIFGCVCYSIVPGDRTETGPYSTVSPQLAFSNHDAKACKF